MYLTCCLWYITRSHTSSLICCVWLQRSQATSDWVLVMYTHTPCDLVRFTWPTFCPSADKLSTRSTNLHLKLEKPLFGQGTTRPQLSSRPRRVESLELDLCSANTSALWPEWLGQGAEDSLRCSACSPGAAQHTQQQWRAGLREAPPVNVNGFLKVK